MVQVKGLLVDGVKVLGVGLHQAVLYGLNVALDVGQGSAQFVGNVGHHGPALTFRILQGISHVVECVAQFGNFVAPLDVDAAGQVAATQPARGGGEAAYGAQNPAGEQQHQDDSHNTGDEPGHDQRPIDSLGELSEGRFRIIGFVQV